MSEENNWQRDAIEKLASAALNEQKSTRRWGVFFKILMYSYLFFLLFLAMGWLGESKKTLSDHTALIEVAGVIEADGEVNADSFIGSLHDAYEDKHTKGIILRINSPGGSPVQAGIINDEIERQKRLHPTIPVYAVVEDICASGGYYIAAAADRIYVDKASIVGSIGVLMDGYGFTELMKKVGVERRLMTAGVNKGFLDPFSPQTKNQRAHAQTLLDQIHQQFIQVVREGRGKRLKETPELFSGLFWSGEQAVDLGLADGLGNLDYVAREIVKAEDIIDYTRHENVAERLAKRFGAAIGEGAVRAMQTMPTVR
jgi:protease-4